MPALPSLRQLSYLVELAERLNFRAAAQSQFVTQSTLSAGIKEIESILGVQLVERDKRHVRLTAVGEEVVARARGLLAAASDLAETARSAGKPLAGPLRFGTIPTIAPFLLPEILPPLRRAHPALRLYLREDLTGRLLERLRAGSLDIALIALPHETEGLHVVELFRDAFRFVVREGDPAAREKEIAVRRLDPKDVLLLEEGHCLRSHAITACGPRRGAWESTLEATSLYTLIQMVEGGMGVTLLPELTLKAGILRGTHLVARPFASPAPARTLALVARRTSSRLAEVRLLADFIIERHRRAARPGVPGLRRDAVTVSETTTGDSPRKHTGGRQIRD
ncbi:MAG: hydrogen peroxide-inducible genes activator [Burkholderiales bacterium]|nr:hydrogen peroxide-inducible genes activator [Burkholderiales bacterium]